MSINLSIEKANDLFKKIGVDVAVVAEAETADQNPDIENMAKAVFNEMETKIKHDVEYEVKDLARKEEAGKQLGSMRRALKRTFGIDEKELAELNMDEMFKLAKEKETSNKDGANKDYLKIYEDSKKEWEEEKETLVQSHARALAESEEKFVMRDIKDRFTTVVTGMPRKGGDVIKQVETLVSEVKNKYNLKINPDTKEVEFYEKDNPEKKVFDGKNVVTDKYYAKKYLEDMGVYATDTRDTKPSDVLKGDTKILPGIATVEETDPMAFLEKTFQQAQ